MSKTTEFIKIGDRLVIKPNGADYDLIPGKVYDLSYDRYSGDDVFKENGELSLPSKVYTSKKDEFFKKRVLTYFNNAFTDTTGVMLAGTKGTGKTIMAKVLAKESNLPIIIVDPQYPEHRLIKYFKQITTPVCILFDEVDKSFDTEKMLGILSHEGYEFTDEESARRLDFGRAFEQIRNSIGYPALNVKIGATHGGISVGEDGASHQCCEDFALMRSIPGMVIICPADAVEAEAAVKAAYAHQGPVYLRFGRLAVPVFHEEGFEFTIGKGEVMRDGSDVAIIANGLLVYEAVQAGEKLAEMGINAMIINMSTVKPIDEELVLEAARKCGRIITCEEHSIIGGLGEAVCSFLSENLPTPVKRIGVQDVFGESGPAAELLKKYGLCADNIVEVAKDFCGK